MVPFYVKQTEKETDIVLDYSLLRENDVHQVARRGRKP